MTMTTVYLLWHTHDLGDDEEDNKLIGVYATEADAELARARAIVLPGFRDAPEGFCIDPYVIGRDYWSTGYATYFYGPDGVRFADENKPVGTGDDDAS